MAVIKRATSFPKPKPGVLKRIAVILFVYVGIHVLDQYTGLFHRRHASSSKEQTEDAQTLGSTKGSDSGSRLGRPGALPGSCSVFLAQVLSKGKKDEKPGGRKKTPLSLDPIPSMNTLWGQLRHRLSEYAIQRVTQLLSPGEIDTGAMEEAVTHLQRQYFSPQFVEKALLHPLRTETANQILQIIERRLEDPQKNPPLQIFTYGGSVVFGSQSYYNDWWLSNTTIGNRGTQLNHEPEQVPWPLQLERLWNDVLFHGRDVVRVHNLSAGGVPTEMGTLSLQYHQFGENNTGIVPDVIIHAYGNNDVFYFALNETKANQDLVDFIEASRRVRCDDFDLPAVMLYDDYIGLNNTRFSTHRMSTKVFEAISGLSSWYDLLAVSYGKAFRNIHFTDENHLRLGVGDWVHPQMLYHVATAPWLLTYSILSGLLGACDISQDPYADTTAVREMSKTAGESVAANKDTPDVLRVSHIPTHKNGEYKPLEFTTLWKKRTEMDRQRCSKPMDTNKCLPHSVLATRVGGVNHRMGLKKKMWEMDIRNNTGWKSVGTDGAVAGDDRVGWEASGPNAEFTVTIPKAKEGLQVVLVGLVSYGEKWKNSTLAITAKHPQSGVGLGSFMMRGVHESKTSVSVVRKLTLNKKLLKVGSPVQVRFRLIGGSTFKLFGILFCPEQD